MTRVRHGLAAVDPAASAPGWRDCPNGSARRCAPRCRRHRRWRASRRRWSKESLRFGGSAQARSRLRAHRYPRSAGPSVPVGNEAAIRGRGGNDGAAGVGRDRPDVIVERRLGRIRGRQYDGLLARRWKPIKGGRSRSGPRYWQPKTTVSFCATVRWRIDS